MSSTTSIRSRPFLLGEWTVDPDAGTLSRGEEIVRLQPKMMDTLVAVAERAGQVVTKEELLNEVWDGVIVEEGALAQCIHALRKALGDDARQPIYVETIPRRGYRLIAEVQEIEDGEGGGSSIDGDALADTRHRRYLPLLLGLTLAVPLFFWWLEPSPRSSSPLLISSGEAAEPVLPTIVVLPPWHAETTISLDGLASLLHDELVQGGQLRVVSEFNTRSLQDELPWQAISRLGADWAVSFELISEAGTAPALQVELLEITPEAGFSHQKVLYPLTQDRLSQLPFQISSDLHKAFGYGVASRPLEDADPDAFALYLEGIALMNPARQAHVEFDDETALEAVELLSRAVEIDAGYAPAQAALSRQHSYLYFNTDQRAERRELARRALEAAQRLAPDLREVLLAEAYFSYHAERDYQAAIRAFTRAADGDPTYDREVLYGIGLVKRRQSRLAEAAERLEKAFMLDSQNAKLAGILAKTYIARRAHENAEKWSNFTLSIDPNLPQVVGDRVMNMLAWKGCPENLRQPCSTREARELLAQLEPAVEKKGFLSYFVFLLDLYDAAQLTGPERLDAYRAILDWLEEIPEEERNPQDRYTFFWRQVLLHRAVGEDTEAGELISRYREHLEAKVDEQADYPYHHAYLAMVNAFDGDPSTARVFGDRAVELAANDLYSGPRQQEFRAVTLMLIGDTDAAFQQLEALLARDYQYAITPMHLRLEPIWEPLRRDPRFEELLESR